MRGITKVFLSVFGNRKREGQPRSKHGNLAEVAHIRVADNGWIHTVADYGWIYAVAENGRNNKMAQKTRINEICLLLVKFPIYAKGVSGNLTTFMHSENFWFEQMRVFGLNQSAQNSSSV